WVTPRSPARSDRLPRYPRSGRALRRRGSASYGLGQRRYLAQEVAGGEEGAQRLAVLVTGEPGLAPLRFVQLRVVPGQRPYRDGAAALGRADERVHGVKARRRDGSRLGRAPTCDETVRP